MSRRLRRTSEDLLHLVESWHRERRTVAAVLHDLDQVEAHFPDTLLIARECVAWRATPEVVTAPNLPRAPYVRSLVDRGRGLPA